MKIALIGRKNGQSDSAHKNLNDMLMNMAIKIGEHGHDVIFDKETATNLGLLAEHFANLSLLTKIVPSIDVCIVMGGDGTMLNASKLLTGIPILGINLGRVGFITDVPHDFDPDRIIEMLEHKIYNIEKRTMLEISGKSVADGLNIALNDVVISRATGKIIEFNVKIDNEHAYTARGDGLMITTPTGSTAYALSGGGPIIHPTARVFEILPIMAQSLSTRPLIINDTSSVEIELVSGSAEIYIDGNLYLDLKPSEHICVSRANSKVEFIHPILPELTYSYYKTLAEKLNWHHLPGTPK